MSMPNLRRTSTHVNIRPMTSASRRPASCCAPVLEAPLGKRDADDLAAALRALADPVRLRLLSFIAAQPGTEACVCHLTGPVGLSQPTVSHHLKLLHEAGILGREKRGAWVFYRILPERLEAIRATLATTGLAGRGRTRHA
jgi:ArsR family transcriptional regulator, arsenate/arsenite/antimonite-responsive transcriptional repressor